MLCFITVDTEEDNWGDFACQSPSVENVRLLTGFQRLCDEHGAVPTYLTNWPVAATPWSRDLLRELVAAGRCEIGAHCHPWNTPPLEESVGPAASWMSNLDSRLVGQKLENLHRLLTDAFGREPRVFRAGRWAFGPGILDALAQLGYQVDSSVAPYVDWSVEGGPDGSLEDMQISAKGGGLLEIPPTIGFLEADQRRAARAYRLFRRLFRSRHRARQEAWGNGPAARLGLASLRWLSPEHSSAAEMIRLGSVLRDAGYPWLNVPLHSVTLLPGRTPFVRTLDDQARFLDTVREFLAWASDAGVRFAGLSTAPALLSLQPPADQPV
jgi:hypothetical protein